MKVRFLLNGEEVHPPIVVVDLNFPAAPLKRCTVCKEKKPYEEFSVDLRTVTGRFAACRVCDNYRGKARKKERKERNQDFKFQ